MSLPHGRAEAESRAAGVLRGAAAVSLLWLAANAAPAQGPPDRAYPHGEYQEDCSFCHRTDQWLPAQPSRAFDHARYFPLQGAHRTASCRSCHVSLDFRKTGRECVSCHQDPHLGEFGLDCSRCHTPRSFIDRAEMVRFHRTTRFPLSGAHAAADCESCHRSVPQGHLEYVGLGTECADCHANSSFGTARQRPADHVTAGFSLECAGCHSTVAFEGVSFNHDATGFPLTGAHRSLACARCHGSPFNPHLDPSCVACHRSDYQKTTNPNHVAAGFPIDCTLCHNTTSFAGATFDHSTTRFPLDGAHVGLPCVACHGDGVYAGKPTACVACHLADYNGTTDPNHAAAGFSTDCTLCHNTSSFQGARYLEHDARFFPIYSGTHSGRWSRCSDCHTNPANYSVFNCLGCHSQADTDPQHTGVPDYVYSSAACYSCHPQGVVGR